MNNNEEYIKQNLDSIIENKLFPIIKADCVSKNKTQKEMLTCAGLVKEIMYSSGINNLEILQTDNTYPAVYGEIKSPIENAPTILIQGHYDVQPSDSSKWTKTKPNNPLIIQEENERRIYGRGTSDDWRQVLTHIVTVESYLKTGKLLPVNIKFLIEGGEEVGSQDMNKLLEKYKEKLSTDVVVITDSAPGRMDHPVITTTTRGIVTANINLKTGTNPPHSGDNLAQSAVELLSYMLITMKEYETGKIQIPGFYDKVKNFTKEEREKFNAMKYDLELYKKTYGLEQIITEKGYTPQETMWIRPSYQVHIILGGEKVNNIPIEAQAYITMRIVPDQNPEEILELFTRELYKKAERFGITKKQLTIDKSSTSFYFSTKTDDKLFGLMEKAMETAFNAKIDYMGCGGTEPIALFHQKILKVPVIFNAYNSPKDHYHGNDESFSIEKGFLPGIKSNMLFYYLVGTLGGK